MKYKLIIWDVDGTLLDTSEGVLNSVRYVIEKNQLPLPTPDRLNEFVGPPIQNSFAQEYELNKDIAQSYAEQFRAYYKETELFHATPYDGILSLLADLKTAGTKMAIATYKREDYARDISEHFGFMEFCDVCYGADNNNRLTKSDIIQKCITLYPNISRTEIVMIGDTDHDKNGAQKLGIDFIGVSYGFGFTATTDSSSFSLAQDTNELKKLLMEEK